MPNLTAIHVTRQVFIQADRSWYEITYTRHYQQWSAVAENIIICQSSLLARTASRCRTAYILPLLFFFFLFFLFSKPISEVTQRISTKLGHIFTYNCYLKNLLLWDRLDINNRKETCPCQLMSAHVDLPYRIVSYISIRL